MVHSFPSFLREIKIFTCVICISTPAVNILFYLIYLSTVWSLSVVLLAVTVLEPVRISRYSFCIKSNNIAVTQWWLSWLAILRETPLNLKEQCDSASLKHRDKLLNNNSFFCLFQKHGQTMGFLEELPPEGIEKCCSSCRQLNCRPKYWVFERSYDQSESSNTEYYVIRIIYNIYVIYIYVSPCLCVS